MGWFGLNLAQDLSPSLMAQAIDSLDARDRSVFETILNDLIDSKITQG